jgi:hypothetical protein
MENNNKINYSLILSLIIILELFSFLSFFFPIWSYILIPLIFIITLFFSYKRLEWGILIILTELIIGSFGHLLSIDIFNFKLSLRMVLWLAVLLAYLYNFKKFYPKKIQLFQKIPLFKEYLILAFFILWGFIAGFLFNNKTSLILADFDNWLYFLLIFPISAIYINANQSVYKRLERIFFLAILYLSFKTLILLFFFSYNFSILPDLYRWLRDFRVAEITIMTDAWPRIFLQSHIYSGLAFLLLIFKKDTYKKWNFNYIFFTAIIFSAVIISFSRSFWLAIFLTTIFFASLFFYRIKTLKYRINYLLQFLTIISLALLIIFSINNIPFLKSSADFSLNMVKERASYREDEAALASRWSLLPILSQEILKSPIIGQGFGKTIKYQSADPRVLEKNQAGWYETHAFEWGYLDIWLKMGIGALIIYLFIIFRLIFSAYRQESLYNLAPPLVFITIVHFFTPYLNHPLGIIIIIFFSCLLFKYKL